MLLLCALIVGSSSVWAQKTYKKITSTDELVSGCKYLIVTSTAYSNANDPVVASQYVTIGEVASNNRKGAVVTVSDNTITTTVATTTSQTVAHEITLQKNGNNDNWKFYDAANDKYLNGGYFDNKSKAQNKLTTAATAGTNTGTSNSNGIWSITISNGEADIVNQNDFHIRFNPNFQGSKGSKTYNPIIATYTGTNATTYTSYFKVSLYREVVPATITAAEYATYCNATQALDFSTTGITVYTATDNGSSVTLNEIASGKVPANTPVVLYKAGADGTAINVPVIASTDAIEGTNDLRVSTGTDVENMYVLANGANGVGFYPWGGTNLSAGKVYLLANTSTAREFLGFDNGTTAIETVKAQKVDGQYYDLQGRMVSNPTKGLYIVNGKKVIIK